MPALNDAFPVLTPALQQAAVSLLSASVGQLRDDALKRGTQPMPPAVRALFIGWIAPEILDAVRWRVDGETPSLAGGILGLRDTPAMTADHVIVFADQSSVTKPLLWAHELHHVVQFSEWGIEGFAVRYLTGYSAIEHAANEFAFAWKDAGAGPCQGDAKTCAQ